MPNSELPTDAELETLRKAALDARSRAHAPYSNFQVGAAVKLSGIEEPVCGCNVENASYGATICAERTALTGACAQYGKPQPEYIVIVTGESEATVPCALCLQVMAEFCSPEMPVYSGNLEKITGKWLLKDLLPRPFVEFSSEPK